MREYTDQKTMLNAAAADGASVAVTMAAFRDILFEISMANFTGTIKFVGSNADVAPSFGSAASGTNPWTFIKCVNLIDGSAIDGGTGLTGAGTTSITNIEANTNGLTWVGCIVSSFVGGTITVKVKGFNND